MRKSIKAHQPSKIRQVSLPDFFTAGQAVRDQRRIGETETGEADLCRRGENEGARLSRRLVSPQPAERAKAEALAEADQTARMGQAGGADQNAGRKNPHCYRRER